MPLGKQECLIIYLVHRLPYDSSILPSTGMSRASNPRTVVYVNLQPLAGTALLSPTTWWSLTPPSHHFCKDKCRCSCYFLLPLLTFADFSYFREQSALCCPDFPLVQVPKNNEPAIRPDNCCLSIWVQNYYIFFYSANNEMDNSNFICYYSAFCCHGKQCAVY